jgi:hypothetical protein
MFPQLTQALAQERVRDFQHAAEVGRRAKLARQGRRSHAAATVTVTHPVAALRSLTAARRAA